MMRKTGFTLIAALVFSISAFAQEANGSTQAAEKWNGTINKSKLNKYLKLSSVQHDKVADICDFFETQMKAANESKKDNEQKIRSAVYANLKLMKKTLDEKQYSSYVHLMALTLRNRGIEIQK